MLDPEYQRGMEAYVLATAKLFDPILGLPLHG